MNLVKPITVRLLAYGSKANLAALRKGAGDALKDEHNKIDRSLFVDLPAEDVHIEVMSTRWDAEIKLKNPAPSMVGVRITLPDMHERMTMEWLNEMKVAKTCVVFAQWISMAHNEDCQMLCHEGDRWGDRRALK